MYFIDTNICIYFLKNKFKNVSKKWFSLSPAEIKISSIVKAELFLALYKAGKQKKSLLKMESFLEPYEIVPFAENAIFEYAEILFDLERKKISIDKNRLMIAATAKAKNAVLVTDDVREFSHIKNLKIENWAE